MKLKKLLTIFIVMGIIYIFIEVVIRTVSGSLVGFQGLSRLSLAGWSSLWMFCVGGIIGVLLGLVNEFKLIKNHLIMVGQCIIGTFIIITIEFVSGLILNIWLDLSIWNYADLPLNILGQVCMGYSIVWFLLCPFAFWLDDFVRSELYNEDEKYSLMKSYRNLFTLR